MWSRDHISVGWEDSIQCIMQYPQGFGSKMWVKPHPSNKLDGGDPRPENSGGGGYNEIQT